MFIVINAPSVFNALWAIVKPLMREETRKKTIILGSKFDFANITCKGEPWTGVPVPGSSTVITIINTYHAAGM